MFLIFFAFLTVNKKIFCHTAGRRQKTYLFTDFKNSCLCFLGLYRHSFLIKPADWPSWCSVTFPRTVQCSLIFTDNIHQSPRPLFARSILVLHLCRKKRNDFKTVQFKALSCEKPLMTTSFLSNQDHRTLQISKCKNKWYKYGRFNGGVCTNTLFRNRHRHIYGYIYILCQLKAFQSDTWESELSNTDINNTK